MDYFQSQIKKEQNIHIWREKIERKSAYSKDIQFKLMMLYLFNRIRKEVMKKRR